MGQTRAALSRRTPRHQPEAPREGFDRPYLWVLTASHLGDEATVTRFTPMALAAYVLTHYEAETKAGRPEYAEHRFSVEEFRKAAQRGP